LGAVVAGGGVGTGLTVNWYGELGEGRVCPDASEPNRPRARLTATKVLRRSADDEVRVGILIPVI
jgi:hypothetical protein